MQAWKTMLIQESKMCACIYMYVQSRDRKTVSSPESSITVSIVFCSVLLGSMWFPGEQKLDLKQASVFCPLLLTRTWGPCSLTFNKMPYIHTLQVLLCRSGNDCPSWQTTKYFKKSLNIKKNSLKKERIGNSVLKWMNICTSSVGK